MAHIEDNVLKIFVGATEECNILTATPACTVNVGDTIQVGCYAYWSDDNSIPMAGIEVWLRFQNLYASEYHDVLLGPISGDDGWFARNHTVTEDDIDGLGDVGGVRLFTYTDPIAWSTAHGVYYEQAAPCTQQFIVKDVVSGAVISGATVHCDSKTCTTGSDGKCGIEVEDGKGYDYYASKSGYEDSSTYHTTFCTGIQTLKLRKIIVKEETDLTCQPSATEEGSSAVLEANLKAYDPPTVYDIPNKLVIFVFRGYTYTDYTDSNGNAQVTIPASRVPSAGTYSYTASFAGDTEYYADDCTGTLTVEPKLEPEFEFVDSECYMGYNCDLSQATCEGKCYKDQTAYVTPGEKIVAVASVKNVGNAAGTAILKVYHGTTKLCETDSGFDIDPGQTRLIWHSCFDMPNANRDLVMKVYYGTRLDDTVGCGEIEDKGEI